jgi:hypothetical protein
LQGANAPSVPSYESAGPGGGGYFGGGSGAGYYNGGGGGSGYLDAALTSTSNSNSPRPSGSSNDNSGALAPNSSDANYIAGVAAAVSDANGGNGLIVMEIS